MKIKVLRTVSKNIAFRGTKTKRAVDFSSESMQVRRNKPVSLKL